MAALSLVGAGTAAAVDGADQTLTVEGTLVNLVVEQPEGQVAAEAELEVRSAVEVDGELHELPAGTPVEAGSTGDDVTVTIEADGGLAADEALEIATEPVDPALGGPRAEIVEVAAVGGTVSATTEAVLAEGVVGTHTLTVLPVYWTGTDGTSQTTLNNLAASTAQYWAEQSGGGISVSASARPWAAIADPGTCDTGAIMDRALAAHGVAKPSGNAHVLVYFPKRADCGGWAGLASIRGGYVWVNGAPLADVFAHEFGHNLGLGHANRATCTSGSRVPLVAPLGSSCQVSEYQDRADVMGIATVQASGNLNSALADYLGLVNVQRIASGGSATVDLAPLSNVGALRSVAIQVSGGTVYVDFRPATGRDVRMPGWAGVQVHYRTLNGSYGYPTSYLLDMTAPATSSFSAPAFPAGGSWAVPGTSQVVTVESVGATARVRVGVAGSSTPASVSPGTGTLQAYVVGVYDDLLNRSVDAAGLAGWTQALSSGTPRVEVANGITYSREYRSRLITESYKTYLGRVPDAAGLEGWLGAMARGVTIQEMEAGFLAAPEYYDRAGGTDAGWITKLYAHVLGRAPSGAEVQAWVGAARTSGRYAVSLGFLTSYEHLSDVVNGHYLDLLGRGLDPQGQAGWVRAIQNGYRLEAVIGGIIASDEYFQKG